jgi:hypothetical protein
MLFDSFDERLPTQAFPERNGVYAVPIDRQHYLEGNVSEGGVLREIVRDDRWRDEAWLLAALHADEPRTTRW